MNDDTSLFVDLEEAQKNRTRIDMLRGKPTKKDYGKSPKYQKLTRNFEELMSISDTALRRDPVAPLIDYVYNNILNPDIKNMIINRTIKSDLYIKLLNKILDNQTELSEARRASQSTDIIARQQGGLIPRDPAQIYANHLTDGILAIESGFTEVTVNKHLARGISGGDIADYAFVNKQMGSNTIAAKELRKGKIANWHLLIDIAHSIKYTIKGLTEVMLAVGCFDAEDIVGIVEDCESTVYEVARRKHWSNGYAWKQFWTDFVTANGEVDKTLDMFCANIFRHEWNEISNEGGDETTDTQFSLNQVSKILNKLYEIE